METLRNSNGREYEILDNAGRNYLLRDIKNNEYVIARGWDSKSQSWMNGSYFMDKEAATKYFQNYNFVGSYGY